MLLSSVRFGSTLVYSSRGTESSARISRDFVRALKQNKVLRISGAPVTASRFLARRMTERRDELPFSDKLSSSVILVPMPRAGLRRKDAMWPAFELSRALLDYGFGSEIRDLLARRTSVQKAATSSPVGRPTARQHCESMEVVGTAADLPIVIVDDVITRGATLLGAASRLRATLPEHDIFGFAAARTISLGEVPGVFAPVIGTVSFRNDQTFREP